MPSAYAQDEIKEEQIALNGYIDDSGKVLITGYASEDSLSYMPFLDASEYTYDNNTNQLYAVTDQLTSKNAQSWHFNFSFEGYYSDYSITLYFPPGAEFTGFEVSPGLNYRLHIMNDSLAVSAQGYRIASPGIGVEYKQGTIEPEKQPDLAIFLIPGVIILISIPLIHFMIKKRGPVKEEEPVKKELNVTAGMQKVIDTLSDNEKAIIRFMIKSGGAATQADIRYGTGIPKSSLSGIINALGRKKIIKKREYGRTNVIELSEWFLSENEP